MALAFPYKMDAPVETSPFR